MSEKTIYLASGSEDGILGAASNIKAAYRLAAEYAEGNNDNFLSYPQIVKELKKYNEVHLCDCYAFGNATIKRITLYTS